MKTIKYSTKHLESIFEDVGLFDFPCYLIYDKDKRDGYPVAIYINKDDIRLGLDIPLNPKDYKYFGEMCEIVKFLKEMEEN